MLAYAMQRVAPRPGAPVPERSSCYAPPAHIIAVACTAARAYYPIAYTMQPAGAPGLGAGLGGWLPARLRPTADLS